ncbi:MULTISPECIES: photosynthetic reaction center subunit H [unclassified Novosphingobium]|uniref:photosynthetic reaction center subunit H n=1 Tax=unclassified Novosphingobium TaxID=2644732 RepID=UPI0003B79384|nr:MULTISPECIES: photosynthetic reaction center subunit H [unclassified Novosphingobium]KPF54703.1 photosynthetic reaction center subunit H [Novosphingobium sp. AAP1]PTR13186.1 photosynthetic reaction center H subunit [Novosphingobium sp. GV055]PUB07405.1 photosynthetic reaction center H subunit [Novosphingobium sp. GV061]PUB23218.1 photosynthetic reaction center H subunit [Novosphingobium sp. GV079]PUB44982.1 photosynthetic reaction center H subunit [Novosphingobium sp. GV027]
MRHGNIVGTVDAAQLALIAFVLFFICLIFWLRREDRREGYPLEDALTGRVDSDGGPLSTASAKTFVLPFGMGTVTVPLPASENREPVEIKAERRENFGGAPYSPVGDVFAAGVGPGAYANRARFPDRDAHGNARIVPIGSVPQITVASASTDPRGLSVYGADGARAGTVADLWIDRAEHMIRYLAVDTGTRIVLAPMAMAVIRREGVIISAINAADFANAPFPENPGEITRYEEERVVAYFGTGYLYANADRLEPLL